MMTSRKTESLCWQENLLRSGELTDCTFRFETGPGSVAQSLEAHKLILALASPVFSAMFYGDVGDKKVLIPMAHRPIDINDIKKTTFSSMLNYIYTDEVDITSIEAACDLLRAAKKYILVYLEKKCINYLFDKLSPQNVCYVYEFACSVKEDVLIQKCLEMFSKNTHEILLSGSFKNARLETLKTIYSLVSPDSDCELALFEVLVGKTKNLELD